MSADNQIVIQQRADGRYVAQMHFVSNDELPDPETRPIDSYATLQEAIDASRDWARETEYGLYIAPTVPKFNHVSVPISAGNNSDREIIEEFSPNDETPEPALIETGGDIYATDEPDEWAPIIWSDIRVGMLIRATRDYGGVIMQGPVHHIDGSKLTFTTRGAVFLMRPGWSFQRLVVG